MDAVQQWRYKPTLLNGDPVEVDTTISVVFTLGRISRAAVRVRSRDSELSGNRNSDRQNIAAVIV